MPVNEIFKKLVESELLTEATRTELEKAITEAVTEAVESAKKETRESVQAELTEQFVIEKEQLIEALDTKATEFLTAELAEFKDDVAAYKDLKADYESKLVEAETRYAEKLVEDRKEMAETLKADMATLVETVDGFLEQRLKAEFEELKEDIAEQKKLNFGKKLFEAFADEYAVAYEQNDETAVALTKVTTELTESKKVLETVKKELDGVKRQQKLSQVLESLQGRPREVMAAILNNVTTDKLEEQYNTFIGRVLHESVASKVEESTESEKENGNPSVLAEGKDNSAQESEVTTKVVTGDTPVVESKEEVVDTLTKLTEAQQDRLRRLGGIL
jgi:hypothetical protein